MEAGDGEMHDVVSHRVSLIILHAGALEVSTHDETARRAASELRAAGCQALDELRNLVGMLRSSASTTQDSTSATPTTVLDIQTLIDESSSAGMHITRTSHGNPIRVSDWRVLR